MSFLKYVLDRCSLFSWSPNKHHITPIVTFLHWIQALMTNMTNYLVLLYKSLSGLGPIYSSCWIFCDHNDTPLALVWLFPNMVKIWTSRRFVSCLNISQLKCICLLLLFIKFWANVTYALHSYCIFLTFSLFSFCLQLDLSFSLYCFSVCVLSKFCFNPLNRPHITRQLLCLCITLSGFISQQWPVRQTLSLS